MKGTLWERFWSKVDKNGPVIVPELGNCWVWLTATTQGYGEIGIAGRTVRAHRLSWEIENGSPTDMLILHKCDNPPCIRPDHLFKGTQLDNMQDAMAKGRLIHNKEVKNAVLSKLTDQEVLEIRRRYVRGDASIFNESVT